jgi:propanol-preferring alcohol dehydrogenase
VRTFARGDRVGIPWLGGSCGECVFCRAERENLCRGARFTGYQIDGGYAEYALADSRFCFPLPANDDCHAAPLLCAGLIGYRAYRMAGSGARLGIYGFGAAAHVITQVAVHQGREVYAFVAPGDDQALRFAREVGAAWAGPSNEPRRCRSTARSSSRRWVPSCPKRCRGQCLAAWWFVPAFT